MTSSLTAAPFRKKMPQDSQSDYSQVLGQLQEITKSVLNDLRVLRANPLLASSSTSCRYVDQIAHKTQEVIQIVNQLNTRHVSRHRERKLSKHRESRTVPAPNILENVSLQQYQDMETFAQKVRNVVELGDSLHLPMLRTSQHARGELHNSRTHKYKDRHGNAQIHKDVDRHTGTQGHKHRHYEHSLWCQRSYRHVIPTLENWVHLLAASQNKEPATSEASSNSEHTKMVAHFQRLFDVPTEGGVYTRMNELYSRVGEMQNVLHSLKDILGLDEDATAGNIVTATTRLCELYSGSTTHLLGQLLQQERLDRVISRMDHYRKFFPIFEDMVKELMEILGVVSVDRIVPAVRALRLLVS